MNYAIEVLQKELNMLIVIKKDWKNIEEYLTQYKRLLKRINDLQRAIFLINVNTKQTPRTQV